MAVEVGSIVEGKVTRVTNYGAFVSLDSGDTGLVHISEVDSSYVKDVTDFLHENDPVKVKVIAIKPDGRIDLSIKQTQPQADQPAMPHGGRATIRKSGNPEFEKKLKQFMRRSEERLGDARRQRDGKLG